jgi:hypothetical protein
MANTSSGVIQLGTDRRSLAHAARPCADPLLNLTLFVTLFAVGAAFWFAGRMTLRISRLARPVKPR